MSDASLVSHATELESEVARLYVDIHAFLEKLISVSNVFSFILHGTSSLTQYSFVLGCYFVTVKEKYNLNSEDSLYRLSDGKTKVTVYKFKLKKMTTKTIGRLFKFERQTTEILLEDHFRLDESGTVHLFRCESLYSNYLDLENILDIRDYLDTVQASIDTTKSAVSL